MVADLGTGTGNLLPYLKVAKKVCAVDKSASLLTQAHEKHMAHSRLPPEPRFDYGTTETWPPPSRQRRLSADIRASPPFSVEFASIECYDEAEHIDIYEDKP